MNKNKYLRVPYGLSVHGKDEIRAVVEVLKHSTQMGKNVLKITYSPSEHFVGEFIEILQTSGYGITDIKTDDADLEDVFLQLTGS